MTARKKSGINVRNVATIAVLAAVASVLFLFDFPIFPAVPFYKIDFSNIPVLLAAFAMGPLQGLLTLLLKALIGLTHSTTLGVGELADFLMGAAMVLPAGFLYRFNRSRKGAVVGMVIGTIAATLAAAAVNLWLLIPFYADLFHMPIEKIVAMGTAFIPAVNSLDAFVVLVTVPFNLIKWVALSVITGLIYKPLSPVLHGRKK